MVRTVLYLRYGYQREEPIHTDAHFVSFLAIAHEFHLDCLYPALYLRICMTMTLQEMWEGVKSDYARKILTLGHTDIQNRLNDTLYATLREPSDCTEVTQLYSVVRSFVACVAERIRFKVR